MRGKVLHFNYDFDEEAYIRQLAESREELEKYRADNAAKAEEIAAKAEEIAAQAARIAQLEHQLELATSSS